MSGGGSRTSTHRQAAHGYFNTERDKRRQCAADSRPPLVLTAAAGQARPEARLGFAAAVVVAAAILAVTARES
ncbi:MAG: hypothetical protein JWN74_3467 [Acidobacteriaceae bacterium]|nr:hypothetical protein [Acidobacteriaceae bacterium]